jgi:hypothetical protein
VYLNIDIARDVYCVKALTVTVANVLCVIEAVNGRRIGAWCSFGIHGEGDFLVEGAGFKVVTIPL